MGQKIHYCTWGKSEHSPELGLLLNSATRVGISIDVMPCNGFLEKPAALQRYISDLDDNDLVLATDGYDVLYVQPENSILEAFHTLNSPIVFGGETDCYHHFSESKQFFEKNTKSGPYLYLNSGLIMGYVKDLRKIVQEVQTQRGSLRRTYATASTTVGFFNDQTIFGHIATQSDHLKVDTNAQLFCTFSKEKYDVNRYATISSEGILINETGSRPCLIHISHREKFYPTYLFVANKLGFSLDKETIDWRLLGKYIHALSNKPSTKDKISLTDDFNQEVTNLWNIKNASINLCDHVGIIFIGTGKYIRYFEECREAVNRLFLPGTKKTFFVFTDCIRSTLYHFKDVVLIPTPAQRWPFSTLFRFRYLKNSSQLWGSTSHTVYFDADTLVHSEITPSELFSAETTLFGVRHPARFSTYNAPYESNPESTAWVEKNPSLPNYWQGCFWGGRTKDVIEMCNELSLRIDNDLSRDIIARWHDESHLNKYYIEREQLVHTLHPGFAYPETFGDKLKEEKKIVHLNKVHKDMRRIDQRDSSSDWSHRI